MINEGINRTAIYGLNTAIYSILYSVPYLCIYILFYRFLYINYDLNYKIFFNLQAKFNFKYYKNLEYLKTVFKKIKINFQTVF